MKLELKMFTFQGSPVYLKLWFLLLFAWVSPTMVFAIFLSVLVHELAHAFVANLFGYRVNQIYIDLFYGAAEVDLNNCPERDIIPIVAAGPLSNLFLFGLTMVTISSFPGVEFLVNLAAVNLILFIFNIIPIYPMDGGRLFRAFLMMKMPSNRWKAKRISDWTSLVFCFLLLTYSISTSAWIMVIFSLLFIYYTLKELNYLK